MHTCPVCGSNDALVNVPGAVAQGTQHSHGTGVSHGHAYSWNGYRFSTRTDHSHRSTSSTDLATSLAFPRVPSPPPYGRVGAAMILIGLFGMGREGISTVVFYIVAIGVPLAISLCFTGLVLFGLWRTWGRALVAFAIAGPPFVMGATMLIRAVNGVPAPTTLMNLIMLLLPLLGIGVLVLGWRARRDHRRAMAQEQNAYRLWQGLYYCSRDHVVYEPESGGYGPPGAIGKLVYR